MFEVIFDLETKKFFDETGNTDPGQLGVSVVSVYHRRLDDGFHEVSGQMTSFWESDFDQMWKLFFESDRIVGFNSTGFDVPALAPYAPKGFSQLPHFDILTHVKNVFGHRISLNKIANSTLGETKIDSGENAVIYWQSQDPDNLSLLKKYCEADVQITKKIYDYGLHFKQLKFNDHWNTPRVIDVDFSYPHQVASQVQTSLF